MAISSPTSTRLDAVCHAPYRPRPFQPRATAMARSILFAAAFFLTGCFNGLLIKPTVVDRPLEESIITDARHWTCRSKVAIIDIDGMILNARSSGLLGSGENPMAIFRERLDAAADDPHVKAVVLRINSAGGAV